jgi:hypothetical protein
MPIVVIVVNACKWSLQPVRVSRVDWNTNMVLWIAASSSYCRGCSLIFCSAVIEWISAFQCFSHY